MSAVPGSPGVYAYPRPGTPDMPRVPGPKWFVGSLVRLCVVVAALFLVALLVVGIVAVVHVVTAVVAMV
jgi:hypothetical protein